MTRWIIGDLRTGRRILDLPVLTGTWDDNLDTAETITATVDMQDPDVQALNLRNSATPAKAFLAVVEGTTVMAAGPIWTADYDRDNLKLELGAKGLASYYDHRLILPLLAASLGVDQWTIPDPDDATKTIPNPDLTTSFVGIWLGTIAKKLVQQAHEWTGGSLPVIFQSDEADGDADHDKTYLGTAFKPVGEALTDLTNLIGGPEINFQGRFMSDKLGIEWLMQVGTVTQPLLFSPTRVQWDVTVAESPVSGLTVSSDASKLGSLSWATGGGQTDDVLVARAYSSTLVDAGYPLMEVLDSSHTSVSVQSTLDGYAQSNLLLGQSPTETWTFTVEAFPTDENGATAGPQLSQYATGDFADLIFARFDPDTGVGDPYLSAGGVAPVRIIGRSGDQDGVNVKITCAPLIGGL